MAARITTCAPVAWRACTPALGARAAAWRRSASSGRSASATSSRVVHGVVHGDARDAACYAAALQGERAAAIITDPPYCLLRRAQRAAGSRPRKLDHDLVVRFADTREYRRFTDAWMAAAVPHLSDAPGASLIVWTNYLGRAHVLAAAAAAGVPHCAGDYVWAKRSRALPASGPTSELLLRVYEVALVLTRAPLPARGAGDPPLPWAVVTDYHDNDGSAAATAAGATPRRPVPPPHPHCKPRAALTPLLQAWTRPGDLVLDPFAGSAAIGDAARALGRRAAGIELRPGAPEGRLA